MNKISKHKNSTRTVKSSRNLTLRQAELTSSRTPQSNKKKLQLKKSINIKKFKSIPTIPCRDIQMATIPTQNIIYQSYNGQPLQSIAVQQSQPRFLYSVSDRNYSISKASLNSKLPRSGNKTIITSKNKSSFTLKTNRKSQNLQNLYQRTKTILDSYRVKEDEWKKQKNYLIKQLQKYKQKISKRKNNSIISQLNKRKK